MNKSIKELTAELTSIETEIFERFKFQRGWHVAPIENCLEMYWCIIGGELKYQNVPIEENVSLEEYLDQVGFTYSSEIRGDICRADGCALIYVDTNCDFNEFLYILDEDKEIKEKL